MKWLILAIFAEVSVLLCLIFAFDDALHSLQSARLTWDHAVVVMVYAYARVEFSRKRIARPSTMLRAVPSTVEGRQSAPARVSVR
jgi:hypothetical protein